MIDFQMALPEEIAQRITAGAQERGVTAADFLSLLIGLSLLPQMRLSEDCALCQLSDTVMAFFQRRAADIEHESGKAADWIHGVNDYREPQSLEELKPRVKVPPGKTLKDYIHQEPWPGEETDEELLAALKAMG